MRPSSSVTISWAAMLLASSLSLIVWRELASGEPYWWPWVTAVGLLALLALTFIREPLRPMRPFLFILALIFFLGVGGGWQWGLIPFIRSSPSWITWASQSSWTVANIALHLLRLVPALAVMVFLLLEGRDRRHFFLALGKISAPVQPSRLIGMKKPEPWTRIGSIFALVFSVGTFSFLEATSGASWATLVQVLPLVPAVVLIAAVNAFNEEFTLRAAPLSELSPAVGAQQGLLISTVYFGLGHFYGTPNGLLGVLLSAFLGWFLGKSLLETKGFFWAWTIHFVQDVLIFTFVAMAAF